MNCSPKKTLFQSLVLMHRNSLMIWKTNFNKICCRRFRVLVLLSLILFNSTPTETGAPVDDTSKHITKWKVKINRKFNSWRRSQNITSFGECGGGQVVNTYIIIHKVKGSKPTNYILPIIMWGVFLSSNLFEEVFVLSSPSSWAVEEMSCDAWESLWAWMLKKRVSGGVARKSEL